MGPARLDRPERKRERERESEGSVHENQQCRNNRDLGFSLSPFCLKINSQRKDLFLSEAQQTAIIILIAVTIIIISVISVLSTVKYTSITAAAVVSRRGVLVL